MNFFWIFLIYLASMILLNLGVTYNFNFMVFIAISFFLASMKLMQFSKTLINTFLTFELMSLISFFLICSLIFLKSVNMSSALMFLTISVCEASVGVSLLIWGARMSLSSSLNLLF